MKKPRPTKAQIIAATLAGSWRSSPPEPDFTESHLEVVGQPLLGAGAGALGWWRIRGSSLEASPFAGELRGAYHLYSLHARLFAEKIKNAFSTLRSNGIEPILIKGWANARLYPEDGLRPCGDIDLCVRPDQFTAARKLLKDPSQNGHWIDLHRGLGRFDHGRWEELYARSRLLKLDETDVRVLCEEDHLGLIAIHFFDHGAWRPLWLCDIAAAVESVSDDFDWGYCLGENRRRASWIKCAVKLAQELLGARLERAPEEVRDGRLPDWLLPSVLSEWERPTCKEHSPRELFKDTLRHPWKVPGAFKQRWPNPIEATIALNGSFNNFPRLPYQAARYLAMTGHYLTRLPELIREQR